MKVKATDSPTMGRIWAVLTAVLVSYTGYDEYKDRTAATTINVNANSAEHVHDPVLSEEAIRRLINQAVTAQHEKDLKLFRKREAWE